MNKSVLYIARRFGFYLIAAFAALTLNFIIPRLMPGDPIVNDHYGDVLWKNGNEIQARYYWNYVLNLKEAERDLKKKIEKKIIKGL